MIDPLALDWEKDAVKELADMLNLLAQGEFESPEAFCNRMDASKMMILTMWGVATEKTRQDLWSAKLAIESAFNPPDELA
ncbi:MAG: hypothetical protein MUF72_10125 [Elainella sp. Prado103]|jgi:hypothetical protein|nr:hypothetical protein [Elainella sp. Prado103]